MPRAWHSLVLWTSQGFGTGRIRLAPGTWGSLVGLLWFALLLATGRCWTFLVGLVAGWLLSVWFCGAAEKILKQHDPGSIVLDEIVAVPLCFLTWVGSLWWSQHQWPSLEKFFSGQQCLGTAALFLLFRLFDVAKPWPIRQSQRLAGGWGVTADDLLAAVYVNAVCLLALGTSGRDSLGWF